MLHAISNGLKLNLKHIQPEKMELMHHRSIPKHEAEVSANLEDEEKILDFVNRIDEQILQLDNRMDLVLETHEKDFL
jgi:hypothetical protein